MLSFDITDRNIRVVKGVENGGKIKITSAATLNLEENLIINGHVKDSPTVATLINGLCKRNKMYDKEAINKTIGRKPRYSAKTGVNKPHSNTVCAIVLL